MRGFRSVVFLWAVLLVGASALGDEVMDYTTTPTTAVVEAGVDESNTARTTLSAGGTVVTDAPTATEETTGGDAEGENIAEPAQHGCTNRTSCVGCSTGAPCHHILSIPHRRSVLIRGRSLISGAEVQIDESDLRLQGLWSQQVSVAAFYEEEELRSSVGAWALRDTPAEHSSLVLDRTRANLVELVCDTTDAAARVCRVEFRMTFSGLEGAEGAAGESNSTAGLVIGFLISSVIFAAFIYIFRRAARATSLEEGLTKARMAVQKPVTSEGKELDAVHLGSPLRPPPKTGTNLEVSFAA